MQHNLTSPNNSINIDVSNATYVEVYLASELLHRFAFSSSTSKIMEVGNLEPDTYDVLSDGTINNLSSHNSTNTVLKIGNTNLSLFNIDINFFGLYKEKVINDKGLLTEENFYKTRGSGGIYSDLAIKAARTYTINSNDLVEKREETITWYNEDGTIGHIKSSIKYYDLVEAIKEGICRRYNLIDKAKAYGVQAIQGTHTESGVPDMPNSYYFLQLLSSEVSLYIQGIKTPLINAIQNTTEEYITETIRTNLIDILKYW